MLGCYILMHSYSVYPKYQAQKSKMGHSSPQENSKSWGEATNAFSWQFGAWNDLS